MKLFLSFFLFTIAHLSLAQLSVEHLESDPARAPKKGLTNAREESVADINFDEPLPLPFFDDFTSVGPSIARVSTTEGTPVTITTFQPHGFVTPTSILITEMKGEDTADYLNGRWYAKMVNNYEFNLYRDEATTEPLLGKGRAVNDDKIGNYTVTGLEFGPSPDPFKWENSNKVYVNNRFAINPPSIYTATLDGLDANGQRYRASDAVGWADTLTSRKIDLSTLVAQQDSAYLSFWWQGGGLQDPPDYEEILRLEFKGRDGSWEVIKQINGFGNVVEKAKQFTYELIKIDEKYFHNGFQFRFENYGKIGGFYDVWHLDYFLIDKNRDTSRWATNEGAVVSLQSSALKEYSAMPISQFNAQNLNNEVSASIRNISNSPRTFNLPFTLSLDNTVLLQSDLRSNEQSALNGGEFRELKGALNLANTNFSLPSEKATLKYTVAANFSDPASQRINFLKNNNDSTFTTLHDYYAFDDGTSELALPLRQFNTKLRNQAVIVNKIVLNKEAEFIALDLNFPKVGFALARTNMQLRIKIYADNNGEPGAALDGGKDTLTIIQESDNSKYETFQRHKISIPIVVPAGTYYVGFQHAGTTTESFIGIDANTKVPGKQFFKASTASPWTADNGTNFYGTAMIRPVFTARNVDAITWSQKGTLSCEVYPNPSTGQIHIEGEVSLANLYDVSGKLVQSEEFGPNESKFIGNPTLLPGFYFLHLESDTLKAIKKVVIIR